IKHEGKWSDIRTVYASIGQDTVVVTPISMLRAVSSVGMRGKEYIPHFLKEFKPIAAVGEEGDPNYIPARPGFTFQHPEPNLIELQPAQWDLVLKGMRGVVIAGGTAGYILIPDFELVCQTGTDKYDDAGKNTRMYKVLTESEHFCA